MKMEMEMKMEGGTYGLYREEGRGVEKGGGGNREKEMRGGARRITTDVYAKC